MEQEFLGMIREILQRRFRTIGTLSQRAKFPMFTMFLVMTIILLVNAMNLLYWLSIITEEMK